jgi:hypothetical protein
MQIKIPNTDMVWTDETCSNRYGIGCVQVDGVDYGPKDVPPGEPYGRTVAQLVVLAYSAALDAKNNTEFPSNSEVETINRFLGQDPEGIRVNTERFGY